jgi:hypothetical protein
MNEIHMMDKEIEAFLFKLFLFKSITMILLIIIIIYLWKKIEKYYKNKDIEIIFKYSEKEKKEERKEPKL